MTLLALSIICFFAFYVYGKQLKPDTEYKKYTELLRRQENETLGKIRRIRV